MNKLISLKIPSGWAVIKNDFYKNPGLDWKTEDLLLLEQIKYSDGKSWEIDKNGLFIDLGWYPDGNPDGSYKVVIGRDWNNIFAEFESKDEQKIVEIINKWLEIAQVSQKREDFHIDRTIKVEL